MSEANETIEKAVIEALAQLRPFLEQDGGDMELVEITEDKVVRLKLLGACRDCSMSAMTMKAGIEEAVKKAAPEVLRVEAVEPV
ncbi:NifU family protein [Brumimicrobium aurantiacum]|uniref:NifU family protein n=1 Tax=Brumimicrobium aurantiacum TaxID=1737063 RepID=A0A3E1EVQ1_9FLAO|nr:NifU family protein [Brumimicrobium aurantiacum]RFC53631.1 NifU family protein [Brumimicrobium aurantiacum]